LNGSPRLAELSEASQECIVFFLRVAMSRAPGGFLKRLLNSYLSQFGSALAVSRLRRRLVLGHKIATAGLRKRFGLLVVLWTTHSKPILEI
jgi:hypothetical protein